MNRQNNNRNTYRQPGQNNRANYQNNRSSYQNNTPNRNAPQRSPQSASRPNARRGTPNTRRPGIKGYNYPKQKGASTKILVALFGIIAAVIIIILLISPRSTDLERLPDVANDAVEVNADTASDTADTESDQSTSEPASAYADRTAETVTLSDQIDCQYAILIDLENNKVLADKSGDERIYPASMTKVMTILVAIENCEDLEDTFTMTNEIVAPLAAENATVAGFSPGETITVLDMLYGAALPSGADATGGLAAYTAGSEEEFAKLMNAKCEELGLKNTHFVNASGLHDDDHYTTCHDMAIIFKAAMENETARKVLSTYQYTTSKTTEHPDGITLTDTMFSRIEGSEEFDEKIEVVGGKTGYTGEAGHCLVSLAKVTETGKEYILVVANGESKWKPIYDTIYAYRHFLGVSYDGEYVPKYMR